MKILCYFAHKWNKQFNYESEGGLPRKMPSPYTFYERFEQPRYRRICLRCDKEEFSKQDQFGNEWWVSRKDATYNQ